MMFNSGHCFDHITGWITFGILFKFVYSQQQVGDWCELQRVNVTGQCQLLSECPGAIEDLRLQKLFPQTCGFDGIRPIVCCDYSSTNYRTEAEVVPVGSKSNQKCKEYSDQYNKNISVTHVPGFSHPKRETCVHFDGFLIQGTRARSHEFPHMAAIGYDDEDNNKAWLCSGVLISEKFILTTARCLGSPGRGGIPKYIRIGDMDLDNDDDDARPQEFNVAGRFRHPDFKPPSTHHDIGLLKLNGTADFTLYARPACLYTNATLPSLNPIALTWGRDYTALDDSSHLLKESYKFVSHAECERSLKNRRDKILEEKHVCAGVRFDHMFVVGTGVLQTYNSEGHCMYDVVGIGPFGGTSGNVDVSYVFTRVSAYIPWIEEIVWPS